MVSKRIPYFNLRKIMNSGQIFRMYEPENGRFVVFSGNKRLELCERIGESKGNGYVDFYCSQKEFEEYWEDYFDLKRDYGAIVKTAEEHCRKSAGINEMRGAEFLKNACRFGADIRVLKQDIWEMMISFIISQQKQIPSIRKCIEALCERFGEKHVNEDVGTQSDFWYGFPSAEAIASAGPDGMKGLSLGYRERYIYETAVKYLTEGLSDEELRKMTADEAKKYFCSFTGIGDKVADCICLFGAGFTDAFPIDVHIKDILYREFVSRERQIKLEKFLKERLKTEDIPRKKLLEALSYRDYLQIIDKDFSAFKGVKGIIQQWIFAYEISRIKPYNK